MTVAALQAAALAEQAGAEDGGASSGEALLDIRDADQLAATTGCGLTARAVAGRVRSVAVPGAALTFWPPALCSFSGLVSIDLSRNRLTFIPQSVQQLPGLEVLNVARNELTALPPELGACSGLTELDVGANQLRKLPAALCSLTGLKVLNAWGNQLTELPAEFGQLRGLVRLGLKGNQLAALPDSFSQLTNLVELFITDNRLTTLPKGFGSLTALVKLQASYCPLESLPEDVFRLPSLELFRLAVGQLPAWPEGLAGAGGLPRLAWCSLGSNPAAAPVPALPPPAELPRVTLAELVVGEKLGQGASGEVFAGEMGGQAVAIKIFVGGASPDGATHDEIALTCGNSHPGLTRVLALVVAGGAPGPQADTEAHAGGSNEPGERVIGLVMELVAGRPLAGRPTSQHLLRCKWADDASFSPAAALRICHGLAGGLAYLHARGAAHGDVYAHNVILQGEDRAVLCDLGAAFAYPPSAGRFFEAMEVRAFGLLMQDVAARVAGGGGAADALRGLVRRCLADDAAARPRFAELEAELAAQLEAALAGA